MKIRPSLSKYDVEEGFEEHPNSSQPAIQLNRQLTPGYFYSNPKNYSKSRSSSKKEETKLRFISIQRQKSQSSHYEFLKKEQEKLVHKSLTLNKEEQFYFNTKKKNKVNRTPSKLPPIQSFNNSVLKLKRYIFHIIKARSEIGENLQFTQYNAIEVKTIKDNLLKSGASLIFQNNGETSSHGLFKKFLKLKNCNNFLKSKYNAQLLQKISMSFVNPKNDHSDKLSHLGTSRKHLEFIGDFQSSNLDFVTQINPYQYDIYIKADTNTMGHQNWFYFKLLNNSQQKNIIFMNICNLKRGFKMIKKGQKIHYRHRKISKSSLKTSIESQDQEWSEWMKFEEQITVIPVYISSSNSNQNKRRVYKMSFSSTLMPEMEYEFSLLPPFTYSQMLQQVQNIEKSSKHANVQALTFSHLGLCIPIITFTNKQSQNPNKNVILISGRIHPGQTCASFVLKGILIKLTEQSEQNSEFLSNHIIKIIPMLNPDGVVLGNFRTNYLGSDLNRSFHQQNEVTFPEVVALKQLGKKLKDEYKEKFICFLDLHGHSSQKNIFVYGPNYDENNKNYINSRFFPKTLSYLTEEFDYDKCTFALEQCKSNTARGYFLKSLKTMAFTIESSYALYDSNKQVSMTNQDLKIQNWINFGQNIIKAIQLWTKSHSLKSQMQKPNEQIENKKQEKSFEKHQSQDFLVIGRIKKELSKQSVNCRKRPKIKKNQQNNQLSSAQDTDGQSDCQDISPKQRERLQRRFIQANNTGLFPRILRPAIIHPEVNPPAPLFSVSKINPSETSSVKGSIVNLRMKKNRYNNVKPVSVNNAYTEYLLRQVKGLESLRPSVNLMKLSRKDSSLIRSTN